MAKHKFAVGDQVHYAPGRAMGNATAGLYTILRCMPSDGSDPQYRAKHARDAHERVILESQLRKG